MISKTLCTCSQHIARSIAQEATAVLMSKYGLTDCGIIKWSEYFQAVIFAISTLQVRSLGDALSEMHYRRHYSEFLQVLSAIIGVSPQTIDLDIMRCMAFQAARIISCSY